MTYDLMTAHPELEPEAEPQPMASAAPTHDPVSAPRQAQQLPNGFDLSRYGPHVQAAYRGPTPDNPSLSLKKRLSRARALDQRDRLNGQTEGAHSAEPAEEADRPRHPMSLSFSQTPLDPAKRPELSF